MAPVPRLLVAVLGLTLVTLGTGFLLKDSCTPRWGQPAGSVFRALCYDDIVPLYGAHGFDRGLMPYVAHPELDQTNPKPCSTDERRDHPVTCQWGFVEYPVLTGLLMWVAARLGTGVAQMGGGPYDGGTAFLNANAFLLSLFALGTAVLLYRMVEDKRRLAYFAAGTPIVLYSFHNWDLMAVFFVVLTLYLFERGQYVGSGLALAMGFMAKIFPIVIAPLLWLILVRRRHEAAPAGPTSAKAGRWMAAGVAGFTAAGVLISLYMRSIGSAPSLLTLPLFNPSDSSIVISSLAAALLFPAALRSGPGPMSMRDAWSVFGAGAVLCLTGAVVLGALALIAAGLASGFLASFVRAAVRARDGMALAGATILGIVAIALPFVTLGSRALFFEVYRFHTRRTPNFETLWYVAREYGQKWGWDWMIQFGQKEWLDAALLGLVALAFLGLAVACWRCGWGPREAAFASILAFMLLNKIFSVQYALWILPFFALAAMPAWSYASYAFSDAWVYFTVFSWFAAEDGATAFQWLSLAVLVRAASLLLLMAVLAWRRPQPMAPIKVGAPAYAPRDESAAPLKE